ncbi:LamG domain-containing protein [Candidatus Magnetomonas plexicatena]|uniref:LamG domain-containing protein n=1 Tax=Candidatus Magnetomonas plexicatena TaxID=2552947 RepID=UPI001C756B21|nr:LamG domain-containing protein [Nitrospirales bacterium LBB_01]
MAGNDAYTKLLIHFDGSGASFTDSSASARTITAYGNTTQSATQSKFGGKSGYFDGTGDYLTVPNSSDFDFGTGDFTIDAWVCSTSFANHQTVASKATDTSYHGWRFHILQTSGYLHFNQGNGSAWDANAVSSSVGVTLNGWTHIAVVRGFGDSHIYYYVNGVRSGGYIPVYPSNGSACAMSIGQWASPYPYNFIGYMDEFRVSNKARWANDFTPPTSAYDSTIVIYTRLFASKSDIGELRDSQFMDTGDSKMYINNINSPISDSNVLTFVSGLGLNYPQVYNTLGSDLTMLFIKQPLLLERILHFVNDLATGYWKGLYIGNKVVDSGIEAIFGISGGIGNSKDVSLPETISEGFRKCVTLLNGITDPFNYIAAFANTLEEHIHIPYYLRNSLRPTLTTRVSPAWDIMLDGTSIKKYVKKINLTKRDSEPIDHIEIELAGLKLWDVCNPATNYGQLRIKFTISPKGDSPIINYEFYLETREKKESATPDGSANINIWGRQKPAILAKGFASKLSDTYYNRYASEIAAEIVGANNYSPLLTWECDDYWISEFSTNDYPIDALIKLAEAIGAIVRTKADGSLTVRSRFPVKPDELVNETVSYAFDRTGIIAMDYAEEQPECSSVTVNINNGGSSEDYSIEAVDSTCAKPGETLQMRVYIPNENAEYDLKVTGDAKASKVGTYSETLDETITLTDGSGSVSKAIYSVNSYTLYTCDGSDKTMDYSAGSKTITPSDDTCSLLEISYETKYDLWNVTSSVSETVALCVVTESSAASSMTVIKGNGSNSANDITNDLITTENQATTVGQLYLYEHYYRRRKFTLDVPYSGAQDGTVASVDDDNSGIYVKGIVREASVEISLSGKDKSPKFKETIVVYGYENDGLL